MDAIGQKVSSAPGWVADARVVEETGTAGLRARAIAVPAMLLLSTFIMALAWLGHLNFKDELSLVAATAAAWFLVLPEYALNIKALRLGYGIYSAAQMAAFRLCSGVVWVALVSRYVLGEDITLKKGIGFGLMFVSMIMIATPRETDTHERDESEEKK